MVYLTRFMHYLMLVISLFGPADDIHIQLNDYFFSVIVKYFLIYPLPFQKKKEKKNVSNVSFIMMYSK